MEERFSELHFQSNNQKWNGTIEIESLTVRVVGNFCCQHLAEIKIIFTHLPALITFQYLVLQQLQPQRIGKTTTSIRTKNIFLLLIVCNVNSYS